MSNKKLKVLHTVPALDSGGAERILYDYCVRLADKIQFDFIVHTQKEGILERGLIEKGCHIFHIPPMRFGLISYCSHIKKIIKNGKYDIIHVAQGYKGIVFLFYACLYGVRVRIAHSHMAYIPESFIELMIRKIVTWCTLKCATNLFACGRDAAVWMWGEKRYNAGQIYIMTNAIDIQQFQFSGAKRQNLRKKYMLEDKFVIGNVARFSYQKNHEFLINVFAEVKKKRKNAILMLIGGGELEDDIKRQVKQLNLDDSVMFMGIRKDVADLLNAMDVFVLPSRFEGLPVILVEAQANSLYAYVSNHITDELKINMDIVYLPLNINCWSSILVNFVLNERSCCSLSTLKECRYDINTESLSLLKKYSELFYQL